MTKPVFVPALMAVVIGASSVVGVRAEAAQANMCEVSFIDKSVLNTDAGTESSAADESSKKLLEKLGLQAEFMAKAGVIRRLEVVVQRLKNGNGEAARQSRIMERQRLHKFADAIARGDNDMAIDMYRNVFRDVELGYYVVKHNRAKIQEVKAAVNAGKLDAKTGAAAIKQLEEETHTYVVNFGRAYGEYMEAREFLESTIKGGRIQDVNVTLNYGQDANGGQDVMDGQDGDQRAEQVRTEAVNRVDAAKNAASVLARMGAYPMHGYLPHLSIPSERQSISEIKSIFRTEAEALIAKLKVDLRRELVTFALRFSMTHTTIEVISKVIARLPPGLRTPAAGLLNLSYDIRVRKRYLPDIDLVLRVQDDGQSLVRTGESTRLVDTLLKYVEKRDKAEGDEFLLTFARLFEQRLNWQSLRDETKRLGEQGPDSYPYARLYERMLKAEKIVKESQMSHLSLYTEPGLASVSGKAALFMGLGGYWIYSHPEALTTGIVAIQGVFESLLGGKCVEVEGESVCAQDALEQLGVQVPK